MTECVREPRKKGARVNEGKKRRKGGRKKGKDIRKAEFFLYIYTVHTHIHTHTEAYRGMLEVLVVFSCFKFIDSFPLNEAPSP